MTFIVGCPTVWGRTRVLTVRCAPNQTVVPRAGLQQQCGSGNYLCRVGSGACQRQRVALSSLTGRMWDAHKLVIGRGNDLMRMGAVLTASLRVAAAAGDAR